MDTSILDCAPGINMTCLDAYFAAAYRVRRSTNVAMSPSLASPLPARRSKRVEPTAVAISTASSEAACEREAARGRCYSR